MASLGSAICDMIGAVRGTQLYAFADGGTDITRNLDLDLEVTVPLTEPRYHTDDNSPRINLRVVQSF